MCRNTKYFSSVKVEKVKVFKSYSKTKPIVEGHIYLQIGNCDERGEIGEVVDLNNEL